MVLGDDSREYRIRHRRTFGIEQGISNDEGRFRIKCGMTKERFFAMLRITEEIAAHCFAMLAMTPHQITARAYFVRGKQGITERISNIEQGISNDELGPRFRGDDRWVRFR